MAYLRANYEKQVALGLKNVRLIAGDESAARSATPGDDIVGGAFVRLMACRSYSAMIGFMTWASEHGAYIVEERERDGISRQRVVLRLRLRGYSFSATVVNCAGAWSLD